MESQRSVYAGGRPKIAMPAENEIPPIERLTQEGHYQASSQPQPQEQNPFPPVPDTVPGEYLDNNNEDQPEEIEEQEVEQVHAEPKKHMREESNPDIASISKSLATLRKEKEKAERERDEMMRHILQMQSQQQQQRQEVHHHEPEPEVDDFVDLDPDALVDGKYLNKLAKQQKLQRKEQQVRYNQQQKEVADLKEQLTQARIMAELPDFHKVVSQENVAALNASFPEISQTLANTQDTYSKATSAYRIIKQLGLGKPEEPIDHDRARAMKNASKPRPMASVNPQQGDSPLSKANAFANGELTKERMNQTWKEMQAAMKNNR